MKRLVPFAAALALVASPATAQEDLLSACAPGELTIVASPSEPPGGIPTDIQNQFSFLCGQVVNTLANVQPSIGIAFSGGAHTLGTASTIGRRLGFLPRVSVTARFNAVLVDVPDVFSGFAPTVSDGGTVAGMPTTGIPLTALQGDVVVGVFNGFSLGPAASGLGAVDLLGSVSFIPAIQQVEDAIGLKEDIVNIGFGARVGILKQGLILPGVSVSAMYRTMSEVTFGDLQNPAPVAFASDLSVLSLRAGVSKGIATFDFAAGAGYDIYSSDTSFNWNLEYDCEDAVCPVTLMPSEPVSGKLKSAAWNLHANAGLSLVVLNIVGEVGYQKAVEVLDAEAFADAGLPGQEPTTEALEGGRFFAGIGVRLTF